MGDEFETCVRIFSPKFFCHEDWHKLLSKKNCKRLNTWMKKKSKQDGFTNWEYAAFIWKDAKVSKGEDLSKLPPMCDIQPDYTTMVPEQKDKWREII